MSVIILFCLSFLLVEYISWHFKGEKVQKNTQIVMCFLLLFIFFGFRDLPILNDTAHYYRHVRHLFRNHNREAVVMNEVMIMREYGSFEMTSPIILRNI